MPTPVTKAQLSRIRGVSRAALTKLAREGGRLHAAVLPGGKMDLEHVAVQHWLGDVATTELPETAATRPAKAPTGRPEAAEKPSSGDLRSMTVDQVADQFGHIVGFGEYIKVLKAIEEIRRLEIQNRERLGELIEREFVATHVFGLLRSMTRRLLRDSPRTLASELSAMTRAGQPAESLERTVRDHIGSQIKVAKDRVLLAVRSPASAGDAEDPT